MTPATSSAATDGRDRRVRVPARARVWELLRALPNVAKHHLRDVEQAGKRALYRLDVVPPPLKAKLHLTDLCNFRCPTCLKGIDAEPAREFTTAQWKAALDRLSGVAYLHDVTFSGGEAMLRRDIDELIAHAKRLRFHVTVITNGWSVDAGALARLRSLGVDQLIVSLNSLCAEVHDASRAKAGSYDHIMRLVEAWRQGPPRPRVCLETVVMGPNCGELVALARFVRDNGLSGIIYQPLGAVESHYSFSVNEAMPAGEQAWWLSDPFWVRDLATLRDQVAELLRLRRRGWPILSRAWHLRRFEQHFRDPESVPEIVCVGTLTSLYIDPFGGMRLCCGYDSIGNVLVDDPRTAWRSPHAREIRRASRTCPRLCRMLNCNL